VVADLTEATADTARRTVDTAATLSVNDQTALERPILRGCDLNPGTSAPDSSTLTTRLPSDPHGIQ